MPVMAHMALAHRVKAFIFKVYTITAYIVKAYRVMAYIVMAFIASTSPRLIMVYMPRVAKPASTRVQSMHADVHAHT